MFLFVILNSALVNMMLSTGIKKQVADSINQPTQEDFINKSAHHPIGIKKQMAASITQSRKIQMNQSIKQSIIN